MDNEPETNPSSKKKLWIVIILILLVLGGAGYFWFTKNNTSEEISIEITPTPQITIITPEPTEFLSPTPSVKPSSTPKPTSTPKPPTSTPVPPTSTPVILSTTVNSDAGLDGFRSSNNGGNNTLEIRLGRNSNLTTRGFVSFSIPGAVSGKTINSATLRIYQYKIDGNPYSAGGNIQVEHMDYGSTLDSADYSASVFDSASSTVGSSNTALEWKDIDVTTALKNDLAAGHSRSQYRLKFTTETIGGDVTGDFAYFYSSNSGSDSKRPELVIKYH